MEIILEHYLESYSFYMIPTSTGRTNYVLKHKKLFRKNGDGLFFQPRKFPSDPEYISIGKNVMIATNVLFINHDMNCFMLNNLYKTNEYKFSYGCIEIGDNCSIGSNVIILPNVRIDNNCIIGAGAIVCRDIPDNSISVGVPVKVVGSFDDYAKKRILQKTKTLEEYWGDFYDWRRTK